MVVGGVHGQREARRRGEGLPGHGGADFIDIRRPGLFHGLRPHMNPHVGGFHRVIGHGGISIWQLVGLGVSLPLGDEFLVHRVIHGFEVVPRGEVADQRLGVDTAQLFFTHGESDNRHVGGFNTLIRQLFVERNVGVAIDGGDHRSFATGGEFLNVGDDSLVIAVAERRIDFLNIAVFHPFRVQEGAQNFVGGARVNIVSTQQEEAFGAAAVFAHQVFHRRNSLLVWCRAGVEHVWRHLFTFILHRVEQQAVQLFEHRQH